MITRACFGCGQIETGTCCTDKSVMCDPRYCGNHTLTN
jgi:hypothetical protein